MLSNRQKRQRNTLAKQLLHAKQSIDRHDSGLTFNDEIFCADCVEANARDIMYCIRINKLYMLDMLQFTDNIDNIYNAVYCDKCNINLGQIW